MVEHREDSFENFCTTTIQKEHGVLLCTSLRFIIGKFSQWP